VFNRTGLQHPKMEIAKRRAETRDANSPTQTQIPENCGSRGLLEAGVDVRFADLPQIEGPTGRFMLQQMA
jgi:hypothetical protein